MKSIILTSVFLIVWNIVNSQSLIIRNPQNWKSGPGTIQETKITYEPQGLFMKVDWEITFSARGISYFSETDTVEVNYNFNLPEGSMIIDSWLWFGDTILKARIIDRWSASQIYESIVKRRRDPSILFKNGQGNYLLQIYPLPAKGTRKVKISFLTPAVWTASSVSAAFLSEALLVSKYPIENINLVANLSPEWKNPLLEGISEISLEPDVLNDSLNIYGKKIEFNQLMYGQKFTVKAPFTNGYYLKFFESGDKNYYQLAVLPAINLNLKKPQKIVFLIDFQDENSNLSQAGMLSMLKSDLKNLLNKNDSLKILYYNFSLQSASENWVAGDSASIESTINSLGNKPFVNYSNLASLLASGIEFVRKETTEIKLMLISNSDKLDNVESSNQLIAGLMQLANPSVPIYICDFQTKNYSNYYVSNIRYRGNEYFYRNLAKMTGGDYNNTFDNSSFDECFNKTFQSASNEKGMIDIHTTLENGFCYGRYILSTNNENAYNNLPYLEIGQYSGNFPFKIEISGIYANNIFSNKITIPKDTFSQSDQLIKTFWYGNKIMEMEKSGYSYSTVKNIIDESIGNRILSLYTAFLCLEPGMIIEPGTTENKNIDITIVAETLTKSDPEIKIYPNPFRNEVNIEVQLSKVLNSKQVRLEIYDLFGKLVKSFDPDEFNNGSKIHISWDATNQSGNRVTEGTYIFVCTTPDGRISKKIILMR